MSERNSLDEYLKVVDAYVDIVLQNQMVSLVAFDTVTPLVLFFTSVL